jgi:hypothetical protein
MFKWQDRINAAQGVVLTETYVEVKLMSVPV